MKLIIVVDFISRLFGNFIKQGFLFLIKEIEALMELPEEDFLKILRTSYRPKVNLVFSFFHKILDFIRYSDEEIVYDLAVGIAAFNKCPADLPSGSELYTEQIQAAIVLTQRAVLQMDTGEGKTYALLPAAFALSRKYGKVYVVCANSYLAFRDANRTKNYWDYVNLSVNFCDKSTDVFDEKWNSDVIYTTLEVLAFKSLQDDLNKIDFDVRLRYNAIIIDEIDAVLLNNNTSYSSIEYIKSDIYNWNQALEYVRDIIKQEHIVIDWSDNTAQLTLDGIESLRSFVNENISQGEFARFRKAVEISYMAINTQEGNEYVLKDKNIVAVNQLTGELHYGITHDWMIPLAILVDARIPAANITLHQITSRILINQFDHLSGMSGTAQEDMAEYLFSYHLPLSIIPPRKKRLKNSENDNDAVYMTKNAAIIALCSQAVKAIEQQRPVLIGTQNIKDANMIYSVLIQNTNDMDRSVNNINLVTGMDLSNNAEIYENGGECGSVIIATQIAGRGVDIKLSDEARANGGIALLGLGRSLEARYDKQFLGRVGRQGDPYSAKFYLSLDDNLFKMLGADRLHSFVETLGMNENECIDSKIVSKTIIYAQKSYRDMEFGKRIIHDSINNSEEKIWINYGNLLNSLNNAKDSINDLSEIYLKELAFSFIDSRLQNLIKDYMNAKQSETIINEIIQIFPYIKKDDFIPASLEGKQSNFVRNKIAEVIMLLIIKNNDEAKQQISKYLFAVDVLSVYYKILKRKNNDIYDSVDVESQKKFDEAFEELFNPIFESSSINTPTFDEITAISDFLSRHYEIISWDLYTKSILWIEQYIDYIKPVYNRNQYNIARWSIISAFVDYQQQKSELRQLLKVKKLPSFEFQRLFSKGLMNLWETIRGELPTIIINNLLNTRESLDELFIWNDNKEKSYTLPIDDTLDKKWDIINQKKEKKPPSSVTEYVDKYIAFSIHRLRLDEKFNANSLAHILTEFLNKCPIENMQNSEGILKAFETWQTHAEIMSIPTKIQKVHFKFIREFTLYLSEKGAIGKLPTIKNYVFSVVKNIALDFKNINNIMAIGSVLLCSVLFLILSTWGRWLQPLNLQFTGFEFIDDVFFFGFLQKGIIMAPIFVLLLLTRLRTEFVLIFYLILSTISAISLAFFTLRPVNLTDYLYFLFITIALSIIYSFLIIQIKKLDLIFNIPISSLIIVLCFSILLLPRLFIIGILPVIVIISLIIYYLLFHDKLSKKCLNFQATNFTERIALSSNEIPTERHISGNSRSTPHIMGLIFSCILYISIEKVINNMFITFMIAILSYLFIMSTIIVRRLLQRFNIKEMKQDIIISGLIISRKGTLYTNPENILRKTRFILILQELLIQSLVLIISSFILQNYMIPTTTIPLSFIVVLIAVVFSENCKSFLGSFSNYLFWKEKINVDYFDFENIKTQKEKEKTKKQKILHFLNPFTSLKKIIIFIWICLGIIVGIIDRIDSIVRIIEIIQGFFLQ